LRIVKSHHAAIDTLIGMSTVTPLRTRSLALRERAQPLAGTRERGESPWLGQSPAQSEQFRRYQHVDRLWMASLGPLTGGQSPLTLTGAFMDWWTHLAVSPAKQIELLQLAAEQWAKLPSTVVAAPAQSAGDTDGVSPLAQDKRFSAPQWNAPPFNLISQAFLLGQHWWERATTGVPGVTKHHEEMTSFAARQWLDMMAPSNNPLTNPVVRERTLEERGANLLRGAGYALEDALRDTAKLPPSGTENFVVGKNVAVTPGSVIYRNRLIELIQYEPATKKTHPEPILIVPAWIMKYYILDLSPHNSLAKYLVDHGFTVFMISWKNPDGGDRDLGLADYYRLGVREALDVIDRVMPGARTHALGYCLGGTLLAMAAAALGRARSPALKSVTLLAAQTDFTAPGELSLFIDEGQVNFLEHQMWRHGYLDEGQMKSTFQMLRSKDLVWSFRLLNYMLGERAAATDLAAWNADGTRLPFRMHSEYLRSLFLNNALSHGEFQLDGVPINLDDVRVPIFNVGAVQDHVAPWRSVFKLNQLTTVDQTFVLTAGGHNVGIVNPPGLALSSYRIGHWRHGDRLLTPQEWLDAAEPTAGSWWTPWMAWLKGHSSAQVVPPAMGAPQAGLPVLEPAPGSYVHQR
jgi:polyhydroxyalkanoate synthase